VKRRLLRAAQIVFTVAVIGYAGAKIWEQWTEAHAAGFDFSPNWSLVALSGGLVLAAYAVLIVAWRAMVEGWGSRLHYGDAARIWFVSNLGRYVPGKVWQITAMAVLAERAGVSRYTAAGSAILVNLVNLVAGVGVVALTAASVLGNVVLMIGAALLLLVGLLVAPRFLPVVLRLYERVRGRSLRVPVLSTKAVWIAGGASALAWLLYGVAFRIFAEGVVPSSHGPLKSYVGAFTMSYLAGYLFLPAPGGIGVREGALLVLLDRLQLVPGGAGAVIVATSRLWLTLLEVLPGAAYLALGAVPVRFRNSDSA
jgi:uncharacterized membrane protein YbhN (UPF0104 family)